LSEYQDLLTPQKVIQSFDKTSYGIIKTYDELVSDYNKIKSVPENLLDIETISPVEIKLEYLKKISLDCKKEYTLSALADYFKRKIKEKQDFSKIQPDAELCASQSLTSQGELNQTA